jgi:hypothetical protein
MAMWAGGLFALFLVTGCASTEVTDQRQFTIGHLPRPGNVLVYDFVATAADLPPDSPLAGQASALAAPQTAEQIAAGRQAGAQIAEQLVEDIRAMGMPAERAMPGTKIQINDILIRGCILSVDEGSTLKRVTIGFGSGKSTLKAAAEGYQMTPRGLRRLNSGTVNAGGARTPGGEVALVTLLATGNPVGLIVGSGVRVYNEASGRSKVEGRAKQVARSIADQIKPLFQEQCWID